MLTEAQASVAKGLLLRGDKQQDIAAYFGCNSGRIAEISRKYKFADVAPASKRSLPTPQQLMPGGFIVEEVRAAITIIEMALASAKTRLLEMEEKLNGDK